MFHIKRLNLFILQTFLPVFLMTFFVSLFIVLMQFIWLYADDMVGKGLDIAILAELFFYVALTLVPTALPLALLLASLIAFGNLGERLELLSMKAAGVSLFQIMKPLIIFVLFVTIAAFFFQNNIMPIAKVKMNIMMISLHQKSPELEIPEGTFYDEISGYNLFVQKKNRKTGMMYNLMIYDNSKGFNNVAVIVADSGKLKITDDKKYLFLTLYNGETFQNEESSNTRQNTGGYRRETFSQKEMLREFDANFNRMDESILQDHYSGKNIKELKQSADSLTIQLDSLGTQYGKTLQKTDYFYIFNASGGATEKYDTLAVERMRPINIDSLFNTLNSQKKQSMVERAIARATKQKEEFEAKSYGVKDQKKNIRRHIVEMHRKFTLSFACLVFFFIGAPLGAIIRKGGLGMPVVVSIVFYIIYYIIDNSGYKMSRDGVWSSWSGVWLSSFALLPIGIFLTYKAVNDSDVFKADAYANLMKKLFGRQQKREITLKEVIINEVNNSEALTMIDRLTVCCAELSEQMSQKNNKGFLAYWLHGFDIAALNKIIEMLEQMIEYVSNSRDKYAVMKLSEYPVLSADFFYRPVEKRKESVISMALLPLSIPVYMIGRWRLKKLHARLQQIIARNNELSHILENEK